MNWYDVLPFEIAKRQTSYEYRCAVVRMRGLGIPVKEIAAHYEVSVARIYELLRRHKRWEKFSGWNDPPILRWFAQEDDFLIQMRKHRIIFKKTNLYQGCPWL